MSANLSKASGNKLESIENPSGRLLVYSELFLKKKISTKKHLDVGCDSGDLTFFIWNSLNKPKTDAFDVNEKAIQQAKLKYQRYQANGLNFFIKKNNSLNGKYDLVTALEVLEHVDDKERFVLDLKHSMTRTGLCVISVPHKGLFDILDPFNFRFIIPKPIFSFLYKLNKGIGPSFDDRPFHKHFSLRELTELVEKCGLKITFSKRYGFFFFYLKWLYSDLLDRKFASYTIYSFFWRILNSLSDMEMRRSFGAFSAGITIVARREH